jgi:hypothetical protein
MILSKIGSKWAVMFDSGDQGNGDSAEESWQGQDPGNLIEVLPAEAEEHKKEGVDHEPGSSIRSSLKE